MTKKYRDKHTKRPVEIITLTAKGKYPVVYQLEEAPGSWYVSTDLPIEHEDCDIEEIPPEPVKVGDKWNDGTGDLMVVAVDGDRCTVAAWAFDCGHLYGNVFYQDIGAVRDMLDKYGAK